MAIGIGANLMVFRLVDALFLEHPRGVVAPENVARINVNVREPLAHISFTTVLSYPDFLDLQHGLRDGQVAGYFRGEVSVETGQVNTLARVAAATDAYFTLLGIQPERGRLFVPGEFGSETLGAGAVLSYAFWQRAFGADTDVIGRTMRLQGQLVTIIGITRPEFTGLELSPTDLWIPITAAGTLYRASWASERQPRWLDVIVRTGRDANRVKVSNEVSTIYHAAGLERSGSAAGSATSTRVTVGPLLRARGNAPIEQARIAIWLAVASTIVLLLASLTVGELLAARNSKLRLLSAIRLALGSTPQRLIASFVAEALILATTGACAALLLSYVLGSAFLKLLFPDGLATPTTSLREGAVVAVLLSLACLASVIAPSIQARRLDVALLLRNTRARVQGMAWEQELLVALQVMLSVPLVVAAILLARGFWQLNHVSLGFKSRDVIVLPLLAPNDTAAFRDINAFSEQILARIHNVPGITAASTSFGGPFAGAMYAQVSVPGTAYADNPVGSSSYMNAVSSEYFSVLGIPVLNGRVFSANDDRIPSSAIAVVNEHFARQFWPNQSAVGKCLLIAEGNTCTQVIGVVGDTKLISIWEKPIMQLYVPRSEASLLPVPQLTLFARAPAGIAGVRGALERELGPLLGADKLLWAQSLDSRIAPQTQPWHVGSILFATIALLAIVIAAVGAFALAFHSAARREFEFALRMAVGATRSELLWIALRRSLIVGLTGVAGGSVLAVALTHSLGSLLLEASRFELPVLTMADALIIGVVVAAGIVPIWRIAHVDPVTVLRRAN